jgi:NPCBM/NEW2 domain
VNLDVDITGTQLLDLVVGDGGNGNGNDHGDWADAKVSCS